MRRDGATAADGRGDVDVDFTGTVGVVAAADGRGDVDVAGTVGAVAVVNLIVTSCLLITFESH